MCACIGYFDGLHKGHQKLLSETVAMAKRHNCETGMITFDPDPWVVIKGMQHVRHISTMRQRMNLAVKLGMDNQGQSGQGGDQQERNKAMRRNHKAKQGKTNKSQKKKRL